MRRGSAALFGVALAIAATSAARADAIVKIVNSADTAVTIRIDGNFGCRAQAPAPADMDRADRCSFGAATGSHRLDYHFDGGNTSSHTVFVPASGLVLTLTGGQ